MNTLHDWPVKLFVLDNLGDWQFCGVISWVDAEALCGMEGSRYSW